MLHEKQFRSTENFIPCDLEEATDKISGNQINFYHLLTSNSFNLSTSKRKSMEGFQYDRDIRHERVKLKIEPILT